MTIAQARPFTPSWPEADLRLLRPQRPAAPPLPLDDVLSPRLARWVRAAAEAKSAPPDYVFAALLTAAASLIGNSRWVAPWPGWSEPPTLWSMIIGQPSMMKSPGLDAVLVPLRDLGRDLREEMEPELSAWRERAEIAKIAEGAWKEQARAALKNGDEVPARPEAADPGPEPIVPRPCVNDATIEKLAVIVER